MNRFLYRNAFLFHRSTHRSRDVGGNPVFTGEFVRILGKNPPIVKYRRARAKHLCWLPRNAHGG